MARLRRGFRKGTAPGYGFQGLTTRLWLLAVFVVPLPPLMAQPSEYEVKTAFLYNFAKFVEWPPASVRTDAFTLCVLGSDPSASVLETVARGKTVQGMPFVARRIGSGKETAGCHILFISSSEQKRIRQLLNETSSSDVLTVSETPGFAARGGMVNFFLEDDKVRFEINPGCAARAGFQISAQLLKLARLVGAQRPGESTCVTLASSR